MGASSSPPFNGISGQEAPDPVAGKPGHFAWSRWIKAFVKQLDRESVKISGDTMTGKLRIPLTSSSDVSSTAASKSYVDAAANASVAKIGGTMTGDLRLPLTTSDDPLDNAVTKSYVDANIGASRRTWRDFPA